MFRCCARPMLRVYLKRTGGDHLEASLEDNPFPGLRNKRLAARRELWNIRVAARRVSQNRRYVTQRKLRRCYPHGEIKA